MAEPCYADVIIDISHEKVDRPFTYRVPEALRQLAVPGSAVLVPFGRGDHLRMGYCVALKPEASLPEDKIKDIAGLAKDHLPAEAVFVRLAAWMRETCGSTMIQALKTVLPAHKKQSALRRKYVRLLWGEREAGALMREAERKNLVARARLLRALLETPGARLQYELITGKLGVSGAVMRSLTEKGVIRVETESSLRNPVALTGGMNAAVAGTKRQPLSDEQQAVVTGVMEDFDAGERRTYLLHGITGSGKTEVYIRLIEQMLARGRQAIVLIPEIALTFQTLMRFYAHFGDRVSVMNSTLSPGERFDQFERARRGEIDIIIGPRSALFTPFPSTGLIIIDEEHEPTYKNETMPKYHARETAIALADMVPDGAAVLLGSATPSMEAYARAMEGEYGYFALTKRLTGGTLPRVSVVDLREELVRGNRSVFSEKLGTLMEDRLSHGEQIMLFINRRGIAGFVSCRACGHTFKCPHCDVSLSAHGGGRLVCHYCGHEERTVKICPKCGSGYVSAFRAGTEQIEKACAERFPQARILRMDADTTRTKNSYEKLLAAFANREADILIGTQMIVKGHDFPDVTLVGVLAADMSLNASDYRSGERTFQLLTQAAGRAGRGTRPGEVVIQTYQPEHYAVQASAKQDYAAFFAEEYGYRAIMHYPPAAHMMAVQIFSGNEAAGISLANRLRARMEQALSAGRAGLSEGEETPVIIGPAKAQIGKINDIHRFCLYVKHARIQVLAALRAFAEEAAEGAALSGLPETGKANIMQIQFDMDPVRGF